MLYHLIYIGLLLGAAAVIWRLASRNSRRKFLLEQQEQIIVNQKRVNQVLKEAIDDQEKMRRFEKLLDRADSADDFNQLLAQIRGNPV